jgi:hypothetical protein
MGPVERREVAGVIFSPGASTGMPGRYGATGSAPI